MAAVHLKSLIAALGDAVIHTQDMVAAGYVERWNKLFTENEDGMMVPNQLFFDIYGTKVSVPEVIMHIMSGVVVDKFEAEFETEMDFEDDSESLAVKVRSKLGLAKKQTHVKIKATFAAAPPPEMIESLRDAYIARSKKQF